MTALLLVLALAGGLDVTGQIAGVYPVAGLDRYHSSSALLGLGVGYSVAKARAEVGYRYTNLPGLQSSPYRLTLHQVCLSGSYPFAGSNTWAFEAVAGGGLVFGQRTFGAGRETGRTGLAELGVQYLQKSGKSRMTIGAVHGLLLDKGTAGVSAHHIFSIRAGVGYVF
jgi:hypothetical protein